MIALVFTFEHKMICGNLNYPFDLSNFPHYFVYSSHEDNFRNFLLFDNFIISDFLGCICDSDSHR
mgnify:CR=1 FL=1